MSASERLAALDMGIRAALDLIGEGDWTPQDQMLANLPLPEIVAVVRMSEDWLPDMDGDMQQSYKAALAALDAKLGGEG